MSGVDRQPRERAQAMVEFAIVAPILFLLVIAIIQVGYVFGKQLDLKSATADGARRAAVSINAIDGRVLAQMTVKQQIALTDPDRVNIEVTPAPPWEHGQNVIVRTRINHAYSIFGVSAWSGDLRAESQIRVE